MAKQVFKEIDIAELGKAVVLDVPRYEPPESKKDGYESLEPAGPSIEEVEEEIRQRKQELEDELSKKRNEFQKEISGIRSEAENWAFDKVKSASEEYESKINDSRSHAEKIIREAEERAAKIIQEAKDKSYQFEEEAHKKGFQDGLEEGYQTGREEVERLITRLNIVLSSAINKRNEIIEEAERQIIDIVITVARKVVKTISETQKRVVYDNITEALRKMKGRAEITIRVNTEDLQMTTKHKKEFIQMVEGIEQVRILEDNSVDRGGCIITTDFGSIDARISTQLSEIEQKIKEISPFKEEI